MSTRGFDPERPIDRPVRAAEPRSTRYVWNLSELRGGVIDALAASGATELHIDFETLGGPSDSRPLQLTALVKHLRRRGFQIHAIFTLGWDHDEVGCFDRLIEWVEAHELVTVELRLWTPDPGSSLVRTLAREDRVRHRALDRWDGAHVVVAPKQMSAQTLYRGWVFAQQRLNSLGSIWRRRPRRSALRSYLAAVFASKLAPLRVRALSNTPPSPASLSA